MKAFMKYLIPVILVMTLLLSLPGEALAAQPMKVIVGGTFTLESGETLDEDLTIVGGTVVLEADSTVNGKVVVLGGSLQVNGRVNGDILATGGYLKLGETAHVNGDITSAGGYVDRDLGAEVNGEISSELTGPYPLILPGISRLPAIDVSFSPVWKGLWFFTQVLILSALAVLIAMFFPKQLERVNRTVVNQPLIAGGMGLLTGFISPFVIVFLVITICLIPAALAGLITLGVLVLLGWVACGLEVGQRLGTLLKQEWAVPISTGVGTFVLSLVIGGVGKLWCIGWLFPTTVALIGLGGAILTRFGSQDYPETIVRRAPDLGSQAVEPKAESEGSEGGG